MYWPDLPLSYTNSFSLEYYLFTKEMPTCAWYSFRHWRYSETRQQTVPPLSGATFQKRKIGNKQANDD